MFRLCSDYLVDGLCEVCTKSVERFFIYHIFCNKWIQYMVDHFVNGDFAVKLKHVPGLLGGKVKNYLSSLHTSQRPQSCKPSSPEKQDGRQLERDSGNRAERDRKRTTKKHLRLSRHVEVRYMESLRSLKDRLKATYLCNPQLCPEFKKRLEQHQHEWHSPGKAPGDDPGPSYGNCDSCNHDQCPKFKNWLEQRQSEWQCPGNAGTNEPGQFGRNMATTGAGQGTSTLLEEANKTYSKNNRHSTIDGRAPWKYGTHLDKSSTIDGLNAKYSKTKSGKIGTPVLDNNNSRSKSVKNEKPWDETKSDASKYDKTDDVDYQRSMGNKKPPWNDNENKTHGTVNSMKNKNGQISANNIDGTNIDPSSIDSDISDKYTTTEDLFHPSNYLYDPFSAPRTNRNNETNNSHNIESENIGTNFHTSSPFSSNRELFLRNPSNNDGTSATYNNLKNVGNSKYVSNDKELNASRLTENQTIFTDTINPNRNKYERYNTNTFSNKIYADKLPKVDDNVNNIPISNYGRYPNMNEDTRGFKNLITKQPVQAEKRNIPANQTFRRSNPSQNNAANYKISEMIKSKTGKDPIRKAVIESLLELPMYPVKGEEANDTGNAINNLVDYLNNMSEDLQDAEKEKEIRDQIDVCLQKIPIWYPAAKLDQTAYKDKVFDGMLKKIIGNKTKVNAHKVNINTLSPREDTTSTIATTTDASSVRDYDDYNNHSEKYTTANDNIITKNNKCNNPKRNTVDKNSSTTTIDSKPPFKSRMCTDNYTSTDDFDSLCNLLYGNLVAPNQKHKTHDLPFKNQTDKVDKYTSTATFKSALKTGNLSKEISRKRISSHIPIPMNRKKTSTIERPSTSSRSASVVKREKNRSMPDAGTGNTKDPAHRSVCEWIKEIPMYPVLGKEAKDDIQNAVRNLIENINNLSTNTGDADYEEALRDEIDDCLHKLPIWYPGAKTDKTVFENKLVERLIKRTSNKNSAVNSNRNASKTAFINNGESKLELDAIRNAVTEWLSAIYANKTNGSKGVVNNISELTNFVLSRLKPFLTNTRTTNNYKINLKSAIINILNDLPMNTNCPKKRSLNVQRFAEYLVNRLVSIRSKNTNIRKYTRVSPAITGSVPYLDNMNSENSVAFEVEKYLKDIDIHCPNIVIGEVSRILTDYLEMPDPEGEIYAKNEISNLLTRESFSTAQSSMIAKKLTRHVINIIDNDNVNSYFYKKARQPNTMSVYSMEESSPLNYPYTSTPKKKVEKKIIPKLNPQEVQYMNNVANLVRAWMETLPEHFDAPEEKDFKETMIKDLAGDIMDDAKLEQISPGARKDRIKYQDYIVARWIHRLGVMDVIELQPQIEEFLKKLQYIPVPIMTQPQYGNRQAMANIRHYYDYKDNKDNKIYVPGGNEILEDEISIWMNEQSPYVFASYDQNLRNQKIQELAHVLENKLGNKRSHAEVKNDVAQWLLTMVDSMEEVRVSELAENLKNRLIDLPQDATLVENYDRKQKEKAEYLREKAKQLNNPHKCIVDKTSNETLEQEHTMKMFISSYLDQNYDTHDPLARRAFNRMLKTHLQRLDLPTRKEVYDNFGSDDRFMEKKLIQELEYIKIVSDWLKNIPLEPIFNTVGNRNRIDFVNSLAINIYEVEEERNNDPNAMDYDSYMASIILQFIFQLPIPTEYRNTQNNDFMIDQLIRKIRKSQNNLIYKTKNSLNIERVEIDYIGDFIEDFIRVHGSDIAHDEVKLEAWVVRLIKEIKKIIRNNSSPEILSKSHIYNKLTEVSLPGDETIKLFSIEIKYIDEITDWLKNFSLLPINNEDEANDRAGYVCELSEKMIERDKKLILNPNDTTIDSVFDEFVAKWISGLPLDGGQDIVVPMVIQQLRNRMERILQKTRLPEVSSSKSRKKLLEISPPKYTQWKNSLGKSHKKTRGREVSCDSVIDVIERWLTDLPVTTDNEKDFDIIKTEIGNKLCQKLIQLNLHPIISNDDLLYRDMLTDEIDSILENLPQNVNLQFNREDLQTNLVDSIMEARSYVRDKTAGETYKHKLQNTLDASIPNPVSINYIYDPGFEIYKSRLVTKFILENFDHGADEVKDRYEKLLKKEIDRYYEHAKNKNATPISRDEIYNELYSVLYKVPIPNEASIIDEVEEIKTRCEVDTWFEELPIREPYGIIELLEWDKILSALSKRIHEIETTECRSDEKILKEIMKWLVKLPLRPGNETNLETYAKNLQNTLKSTAIQRKCVITDTKSSKRKKGKEKVKVKDTTKVRKGDSQIAGPSNSGKNWTTPLEHNQNKPREPKRNATEELFEIVQTWCNHIPIPSTTLKEEERAQEIKDDLARRILFKIHELNMKPGIFDSDSHYFELLDEELDKILSVIPICCNFSESKEARIFQLKEFIKSVMPLLKEEKAFHKYKQILNNTAEKILEKPLNMPSDKEIIFLEQRNNIIDDFLLSKYSADADEQRQVYKSNIQNKVNNIVDNKKKENQNSLITTNQLICELEKIPIVKGANMRDALEEIRMKKEVADFFEGLGLPGKLDKTKVNSLNQILARKLNDLELKSGHTAESENMMKNDITRCLHKLRKEVNPAVIDNFIKILREGESERRTTALPKKEEIVSDVCQENCNRICQRDPNNINDNNSTAGINHFDQLPKQSLSKFIIEKSTQARFQADEADERSVTPELDSAGEEISDEELSDEEKLRMWQYFSKYKSCFRRPYCTRMVPMRYNCSGYNPYWNPQMPGFF